MKPRCAAGCPIEVCVSALCDVHTTMKSTCSAFLKCIPVVTVTHEYNLENSKVPFKDRWVWSIVITQA